MNKKFLLSTLTAALIAGAAIAAQPDVNGTPIAKERIDAVVNMMKAQGQGGPELEKQVRDQLVTAEVLRQEAIRKGLDKQADVRAELQNNEAQILAISLIKDYQKANPVTDAQIQAEYDKLKATMPERKSYRAQHILVKTEAEALAVIESLKKGKAFAAIAKEKSLDPGSKATGGDLNWSAPDAYVPEFSAAMTHLQKGQITQKPVKTQFGWHVIKLADMRTEAMPKLEDLRPQLQQRVASERINAFIADLKSKAKITQ